MPPRCQVIPLPDFQASFRIDGRERLRWHFGPLYPRPFFFPLVGASGVPLTRMGHPGAPNHDHHRSIWFAHGKVQGVDFWDDRAPGRVRQKQWLAYQDGDDHALMATQLAWNDGHDPKDLLEQELIAAVGTGPAGETLLELQSTFRPVADTLEFGKTNFGFLAVRVSKELSEHFGGGRLTNSAGVNGEKDIFAKPATWMDYSGKPAGEGMEGITYFDHPANPGQPTHWHVRADGWMGASPCLNGPLSTSRKTPLVVRYLLRTHAGALDPDAANAAAKSFAALPGFEIIKLKGGHTSCQVRRKAGV